MTDTKKNQPYETLRDGNLKATMWLNKSENGAFLSTQYRRTYKDKNGNLQDTDGLSGIDHLKLARMAELVYTIDRDFRIKQRELQSEEPEEV